MIDQKKVWNILADSWTNLRVRPWEEVVDFSKTVNTGFVLDMGCGNCRNVVPFLSREIECIGMDFSEAMIKEAKQFLKRRKLDAYLIIADLRNVPFKNESIKAIICNAVLHDIYPKEERFESLKEMKRIARNGCKILISVWNRWQPRFFLKLLFSLFSGQFADVYIDWNYHSKKYKRFYHLYSKKELREGLEKVGFKIEKMWNDEKGNIWGVVRK